MIVKERNLGELQQTNIHFQSVDIFKVGSYLILSLCIIVNNNEAIFRLKSNNCIAGIISIK